MNGVNELEALSRQGQRQILGAEAIDTVPGKFLSPLVNKQAVLI